MDDGNVADFSATGLIYLTANVRTLTVASRADAPKLPWESAPLRKRKKKV